MARRKADPFKKAKREGWLRRIKTAADRKAVEDGCYYDRDAGKRAVKFIEEFLRHSKGRWAGEPFILQKWQREDIILPLFGWLRPDGTRRFRKAYIEIPKKNGKTTLAAALSILMLCGAGEPGAEVYNAAKSREQASMCFDEAAEMVKKSTVLGKRLQIIDSRKHITYETTSSKYAALSADAGVAEGKNIHFCSFDELHIQKTREMWDTLVDGGISRTQPLHMAITTAGVWDPDGIGWEQHTYAKSILDGHDDWSYFAYISAADPDDDWTDPAVWAKANPSLGVTVFEEGLAEEAAQCKSAPGMLNTFLRRRLNIWTQQTDRWLDMVKWDECPSDARLEHFESALNYGGLDLAAVSDLTAFALQNQGEDGEINATTWFWLPEAQAMQSSPSPNRELYRRWADEGHLVLTEGEVVDYDYVRKKINEIHEEYGIDELGVDPWNAKQLLTQLGEGDGLPCVEVRMGAKTLSDPMKNMLKRIITGTWRHDGNPVLGWNYDNLSAKEDVNENIQPMKMANASKIDGAVAHIIAFSRLQVNVDDTSIYSERGVLVV